MRLLRRARFPAILPEPEARGMEGSLKNTDKRCVLFAVAPLPLRVFPRWEFSMKRV